MDNNDLLSLLAEIKPELQCRIDHLAKTWPAPDILKTLHYNESLIRRIDNILQNDTQTI